MRPMPVLLTRPRADAERLADRLRAGGAERVEIAPLTRIVPLPVPDLPEGHGVLFTSGNAVAAFEVACGTGADRPAWVVGPRTAARARAAGFDVKGMAAHAAALAVAVPQDAPPLLHLRGTVARGDLAGALRSRGIEASSVVIYAQEAIPLTRAALGLIAAGPVLAPLYSPQVARLLMRACPEALHRNLRPVCLSEAVAEACTMPPLAVSVCPEGEAMLVAILANLVPSPVEGRGPSV